jgi:hypothetical protein
MKLLRRLLNVLYGLAIVGIFIYALNSAYLLIPRVYTTTTDIVHCENGKSFDPDSKSIYPKGDEPDPPRYSDIRHREISSECEQGDVWAAYFGSKLLPKNYTEVITNHEHTDGSWSHAITVFIVVLLVGLLMVEIVKRLLYYIIFAESVFPRKQKK